jgi:hypothetical protein
MRQPYEPMMPFPTSAPPFSQNSDIPLGRPPAENLFSPNLNSSTGPSPSVSGVPPPSSQSIPRATFQPAPNVPLQPTPSAPLQPTPSDVPLQPTSNIPPSIPPPQSAANVPPPSISGDISSQRGIPTTPLPKGAVRAKALYYFKAESPDELTFYPNDILTIFSTEHPHWWPAELNGQRGDVPANYLQILP